METNDSNIKPQQTGGLKLMTVFIAVSPREGRMVIDGRGLADLFEFCPSVEEAIAAVG